MDDKSLAAFAIISTIEAMLQCITTILYTVLPRLAL